MNKLLQDNGTEGGNAQGAFHSNKTSGLSFWQLPVAHGTELSKIFKKKKRKENLTRDTKIFEFFSRKF